MMPFLKQLSISRDFIERHQSCRISKMYISGGMSLLPHWSLVLEQTLNAQVEAWSPFENIQLDDPNIIPEELSVQATRFAAAVGAAIGGFEES
jgi:Tfp pilus assembly PilM family ATPase